MQLRSYITPTMTDAIQRIREELGDDAAILSSRTERPGSHVFVTAAREGPDDQDPFAGHPPITAEPDDLEAVVAALNRHGTPIGLVNRLLDLVWGAGTNDPVMALASALDFHFSFAPLQQIAGERPLILVGPPGSGKTVTAAKLAARATIMGLPVAVASADMARAGGVEQLASFTRILDLELHETPERADLADFVHACDPDQRIIIDAPGVNPFDDAAMSELERIAAAAAAEPVLVLAAGGDIAEASETAAAFQAIGAVRFVATRLDITRRFGSVLATAESMGIGEVSLSPLIGQGLSPLNPVSLARLLLRCAAPGAPAEPRP